MATLLVAGSLAPPIVEAETLSVAVKIDMSSLSEICFCFSTSSDESCALSLWLLLNFGEMITLRSCFMRPAL